MPQNEGKLNSEILLLFRFIKFLTTMVQLLGVWNFNLEIMGIFSFLLQPAMFLFRQTHIVQLTPHKVFLMRALDPNHTRNLILTPTKNPA